MKDIAKDLGLSIVTISKVLRNHPDIAEDTRERVLKRVKELNYEPNLMARSLVTGRSYLIGIIVPDLLHPFFAEIAKALSQVLAKRGYSLIISSSEENPELEGREIQQLMARQLDALVVASCGQATAAFERLTRGTVPYVLIDREIPGISANFVGVNDEVAGQIATEHLIDVGCRTVAHIRGRDNSTGTRRFEGYKRALANRERPFIADLVVSRSSVDTDSIRQGSEAMRLLLDRKRRPDGVFAYNDPLAIGAMQAILDAGLRIPEDIAVIGCGNLHYNTSLRVPLSSVDQHTSMIGERTANILLNAIGAKTPPQPMSIILDPSLVARLSTERTTPGKANRRKTPVSKNAKSR
ncbi:LacI family transcriptional regulator [Silvibacterium bohemicum]|uniref:LacI family transcriptional regulator n=1 Tax=Silvibacterium bohemicum TaxID=1577686 RepID=A0A841JTL9_9BACT|nr:LacI family DNA-binding transcriptional regulator [Silvibacterium bohemicum]MBB6144676.1 LacI family transcriptional regulator [Silvibacterium bohemicum]